MEKNYDFRDRLRQVHQSDRKNDAVWQKINGAAVVLVSEVKGEHAGLFTHGGHVMAIVGIEPDGRFVILDPSLVPGKFEEEGRVGKVEIKNEVLILCEPEVLQEETRARQPGAYRLYWRG